MWRNDFLLNDIIYEDMENIYERTRRLEMLKGKSVYVSGATGMLASYLVMFFVFLNEVKNYNMKLFLGVRSEEKAKNRFGVYTAKQYVKIIKGDVCQVFDVNEKIDYIVHAASLASPQYYGCNPVETMLPNIVGTNRLLEYAKQSGVESFLFFSSGAVYGEAKDVDIIKESFCGDFDFSAPGSVYGESKRCGEALCNAYFREYDVPVKSVRIHHIYGPTLDLQNDKRAFAEFVKNVVDGKDIALKSDGSQKRAFCYITDGICAILSVLLHGESGQSYNLANNYQFISIRELAQTLVNLFPEKGLKLKIEQRNEKGYLALAQTNHITCDTTKIESLGCKFTVPVADGFRRTIGYFEKQRKDGN